MSDLLKQWLGFDWGVIAPNVFPFLVQWWSLYAFQGSSSYSRFNIRADFFANEAFLVVEDTFTKAAPRRSVYIVGTPYIYYFLVPCKSPTRERERESKFAFCHGKYAAWFDLVSP